jgi:hypothetical protein
MADAQAVALALTLMRKYVRRKRRWWIHPINQQRMHFGEFHHLVKELRFDEERFFTYFRMTPKAYDELINKIGPAINRKDTNYREAVSMQQRLAVTLR